MEQPQNPKVKHHFLPRLYLKGFADSKIGSYVWQYERGAQFCPAKSGNSRNPQRIPISKAAMIQNLYSYRDRHGVPQYDEIENELEKLEKPHDEIIRKVRSQSIISQDEKKTFSCYIDTMMRRVPSGITRSAQIAPQALQELKSRFKDEFSHDFTSHRERQGVTQEKIQQELVLLLARAESIFHNYEQEIPYEMLLFGLLRSVSPVSEHFSQMTWQFFVAPPFKGFITSDNPVVMSESMGLASPNAEVVFPISTEVALVASNHSHIKDRYVVASPYIVKEINQRVADKAAYFLYADRKLELYVNMLKTPRKAYRPIYSSSNGSLLLSP